MNQGTAKMPTRYQLAVLASFIVACLGCSTESSAPATPAHAGEIVWQLSREAGHSTMTTSISPSGSSSRTITTKTNGVTHVVRHTISWRFDGHATGKDKYHFDMQLGTSDGVKSRKKDIEFSGTEVLVFEGDNHKIIIRPKSST